MQTSFRRIADSRSSVTWLMGLVAAVYAIVLFNHGLVPSMEPRFAEVVREMMASGEWLVPIKNGRPYVEYPPLYYWLAIAFKQAGLPMTAAIRLPAYISFLAWLWLLHRWQDTVAPRWPAYAFVLLGATLPVAMMNFAIAQTDSVLALGVSLALYSYVRHCLSPNESRHRWMMWSGVALACAAKGPVGAACTLPVIAMDAVLAVFLQGPSTDGKILVRLARNLFSLGWFRGLLMVAAVTVPWYVAAGFARGRDFVDAVLIYQNVDRYLTGYSHPQPWWYYLQTISYDFFPVCLLLPVGAVLAWRRKRELPLRAALLWTGWTLLFFSVSGSKQGKYLLPAAPGMIVLGYLAVDYLALRFRMPAWPILKWWSAVLLVAWSLLILTVLPAVSNRIGGVDGFEPLRAAMQRSPGKLVHYQWPRSLTLYELGVPMDFVRSARELYARIHAGEIAPGDYILVRVADLGGPVDGEGTQLAPYPNPDFFEEILSVRTDSDVRLLRVRAGAGTAPVPATPEPPPLLWRDELFDTD